MKRALLLTFLLAAPAAAASVELEGRLWSADLSGQAVVGNGVAGTRIDFERDLGLGSDESVDGRLIWRPTRRTSLRLGYTSLSFEGDTVLDRTIRFAGSEFRVTLPVASRLELEYARLGFAWQFLSDASGRYRLGPVVEVKAFRGDASITATGLTVLPLTASEEFEVAFGAAGLALDLEPTRKLHVTAEWTTLVGADEGDLTDLEVAVRYFVTRKLAVTLGQRQIEIDAEDGGDLLALDVDGTFIGAVLRF